MGAEDSSYGRCAEIYFAEMHWKSMTHIIVSKWLNSTPITEVAMWGEELFVCSHRLLFLSNNRKCHTLFNPSFSRGFISISLHRVDLYYYTDSKQTPDSRVIILKHRCTVSKVVYTTERTWTILTKGQGGKIQNIRFVTLVQKWKEIIVNNLYCNLK